jgi:hypothetical protein
MKFRLTTAFGLAVLPPAFLALAAPCEAQTAARTPVDLVLVLAVDASGSITDDRWELERLGYATAFRSPRVLAAIHGGQIGAIAVTLMEWSGQFQQRQVVRWTLINDQASAETFASALAQIPHFFKSWTSISSALLVGDELVRTAQYDAPRKVIDVSGDGPDNTSQVLIQGTDRDLALMRDSRDRIVGAGYVINGLPIFGDPRVMNLDQYYMDNVIGGPGSFMVVAQSFDTFATAVERKLVEEIAEGSSGRTAAILAFR